MAIDFDTDLLKHFVRTDGWLPVCKKRLKAIRANGAARRLRYFTFCAIGAIGAVDVLMLDVARIVQPSSTTKDFDTVVFFGRDEESIVQTRKRIPGAIGFPGNFINVVLLDDPQEEAMLEEGADPLDAPADQQDEVVVRKRQQMISHKREFMKQCPFDVINLDLEEYLFKDREDLPGKVVNSLRRLFRWQKMPLKLKKGAAAAEAPLDSFSLMFTTRIGPPQLNADYLKMLEDYLQQNLVNDPELRPILAGRAGTEDVAQLRNEHFDLFFKLAIPKVIAAILLDEDWYVDPEMGIKVYEFTRADAENPYVMLHLVMDIKRQHPRKENRAPAGAGQAHTASAVAAYQLVARKVFQESGIVVVEDELDADKLNESLELIKARRKKYHPDDI